MSVDKRTPAAWTEYLASEHTPVTITEYMAGCLSRLLGVGIESARAGQHTEGMLGAIDAYLAERDPLGYPGSGTVRAALDAARKAQDKALANGSSS